MSDQHYDDRFSFLLRDRPEKPREKGITMVEGEAMHAMGGLNYLEDLIAVNGAWIDWYKFVWSSFPLQPPSLMERKIELLQENDILSFTGGNLLEAAFAKDVEDEFLTALREAGCPGLEVSSTVVDMDLETKAGLIEQAADMGFHVHGEIGRKASETSGEHLPTEEVIEDMETCLDAGADIVIYEMEELEGIFAEEGAGTEGGSIDDLHRIIDEVGHENILFEVPISSDFHEVCEISGWFIETIGPDVNLGNVNPQLVSLIEQQRHGIGPHQDPHVEI